jgi:site-specific DNA recombinase
MKIALEEAAIIREISERFINGEAPYAIALDLNSRGILTAQGKTWTEAGIRRQLHSKRVAGIRSHNGIEVAVGKWPTIIKRNKWGFAQELLTFRSVAARATRAKNHAPRVYILRGLVICGNCGTTMSGCSAKVYRCSRATRQDGNKCARSMEAEPLEQFVEDVAIRVLTELAVNPRRTRTAAADKAEREIADDEQQLRELHDMWLNKEIDSAEYRKDRRTIQARIRENEKKTIIKVRSAEAIADLIGADANVKWHQLSSERKNAVLRFLFRAVIIGPGSMNRYPSGIDFGRVEIEENDLG